MVQCRSRHVVCSPGDHPLRHSRPRSHGRQPHDAVPLLRRHVRAGVARGPPVLHALLHPDHPDLTQLRARVLVVRPGAQDRQAPSRADEGVSGRPCHFVGRPAQGDLRFREPGRCAGTAAQSATTRRARHGLGAAGGGATGPWCTRPATATSPWCGAWPRRDGGRLAGARPAGPGRHTADPAAARHSRDGSARDLKPSSPGGDAATSTDRARSLALASRRRLGLLRCLPARVHTARDRRRPGSRCRRCDRCRR